MKKIVPLTLIFIIAACSQNTEKTAAKPAQTDEQPAIVSRDETPAQENEAKSDTLVALELLKKDSKNVYEKYGIDFTGFCYACDVADIVIENKQIRLVNACDKEIVETFPILKSTVTKEGMIFQTKACTFEFQWIESVPVYELKITGNIQRNDNLRINRYFTIPQAVPRFEVHDCGDFQG